MPADSGEVAPPDASGTSEPGRFGNGDRQAPDEDSWRRDFVDPYPLPRLRGVRKSDLGRVAELEAIAFKGYGLPAASLDVMYDVSGGLWLLAADDEGDWGYSVAARGEEFGVGWIMGMAIHPARQKRGWGKYLLEATIAVLQKYEMSTIRLLVDPANEVACQLYVDRGFKDSGDRIDHFGVNQSRILMTLLLEVPPARPERLAQVPVDMGDFTATDQTTA